VKNKLVTRWLVLLIVLVQSFTSFAQDHLYSQFFNSPLYLNPALTGQFKADLRMNLIYRNQWTAVPGTLSYVSGSIDMNIPRFGGGIGLLFTRSSEGTAYLDKSNLSGLYSYSIGSEDFVLSFGAWDGVYITGGLAPHLAPWLREGGFRRRFEDKGRFSEALARVPTSVVLHRDPGLLGAVAFALVEAGSASARFSR